MKPVTRHSREYLQGFLCALRSDQYCAEIEANFQNIGTACEEFERGFKDGATKGSSSETLTLIAALLSKPLSSNQISITQ